MDLKAKLEVLFEDYVLDEPSKAQLEKLEKEFCDIGGLLHFLQNTPDPWMRMQEELLISTYLMRKLFNKLYEQTHRIPPLARQQDLTDLQRMTLMVLKERPGQMMSKQEVKIILKRSSLAGVSRTLSALVDKHTGVVYQDDHYFWPLDAWDTRLSLVIDAASVGGNPLAKWLWDLAEPVRLQLAKVDAAIAARQEELTELESNRIELQQRLSAILAAAVNSEEATAPLAELGIKLPDIQEDS